MHGTRLGGRWSRKARRGLDGRSHRPRCAGHRHGRAGRCGHWSTRHDLHAARALLGRGPGGCGTNLCCGNRRWRQVQCLGDHGRYPNGGDSRLHRCGLHRPREREHLRRHGLDLCGDRLRGCHRGRRHHADGTTIDIVVDGGGGCVGRIDVRDVGDITDVRHIDVADIIGADRVGRPVDLLGAERDPSDRAVAIRPALRAAVLPADGDVEGEADEADQCRGIGRPDGGGDHDALLRRHPAPAAALLHPAAVVERCEPPGCVIDPGPAPWRDIAPMTVPVGDPVGFDRGIPDPVVLRAHCPGTGGGQRIAAGHLHHHLRRCDRAWRVGWRVAWRGHHHPPLGGQPGGQERTAQRRADAGTETVGPCHLRGLARRDGQCSGSNVNIGAAFHHGHGRGARRVAGKDLVASRAADSHHAAWGGDLVDFARLHRAHPQVDSPLNGRCRELAVIEGADIEFGRLIECHVHIADIDLRDGGRLGPECISGGDGVVQRSGVPGLLIRGPERHGPRQSRHAADAGRRVVSGGDLLRVKGREGKGGDRQAADHERSGQQDQLAAVGLHVWLLCSRGITGPGNTNEDRMIKAKIRRSFQLE